MDFHGVTAHRPGGSRPACAFIVLLPRFITQCQTLREYHASRKSSWSVLGCGPTRLLGPHMPETFSATLCKWLVQLSGRPERNSFKSSPPQIRPASPRALLIQRRRSEFRRHGMHTGSHHVSFNCIAICVAVYRRTR